MIHVTEKLLQLDDHGTKLGSKSLDQWLFMVPLKGGRWHIIPQLAVYTIDWINSTPPNLGSSFETSENLICQLPGLAAEGAGAQRLGMEW